MIFAKHRLSDLKRFLMLPQGQRPVAAPIMDNGDIVEGLGQRRMAFIERFFPDSQ